jgi:hypothetical protein
MAAEIGRVTVHQEVLAAAQKRVLRRLGPLMTRKGFYLAGGTAIAVHLGHRRSVDFDWFTGERIGDAMSLARELGDEHVSFTVDQVARGTLHGTVSGVRVSFFEYRYPLLRQTTLWPEYGCLLSSLDDLACMKLSAVAQRGSRKDFVDLYALGLKHRPLAEMLRLYQRKYGIEDVAHVLHGLVYFDDADRDRLPRTYWDADWNRVKKTIQRWVKEFAA